MNNKFHNHVFPATADLSVPLTRVSCSLRTLSPAGIALHMRAHRIRCPRLYSFKKRTEHTSLPRFLGKLTWYTVAGIDTQPRQGYFVDRLVHVQGVSTPSQWCLLNNGRTELKTFTFLLASAWFSNQCCLMAELPSPSFSRLISCTALLALGCRHMGVWG